MKAYLYENKAYPEKKPTFNDFSEIYFDNMSHYNLALKEWEASGKIVENAELKLGIWGVPLESKYIKDFTPIAFGQQVETEPSGDKVIVTKIN